MVSLSSLMASSTVTFSSNVVEVMDTFLGRIFSEASDFGLKFFSSIVSHWLGFDVLLLLVVPLVPFAPPNLIS